MKLLKHGIKFLNKIFQKTQTRKGKSHFKKKLENISIFCIGRNFIKMIDEKEKFGIKIPEKIGIIICIFLLFMNQLFAFIGGSVFFKTIFHVPLYIGIMVMGLFYFIVIFVICCLD